MSQSGFNVAGETGPNPYRPPADTRDLASLGTGPDGLANLAQTARMKQITTARNILLVIGILTIIANIVTTFVGLRQLEAALANVPPGAQLEQARVTAYTIFYMFQGVAIGLGVLFIVMGTLVKRWPVPITVSALVIYVLAIVGFGLLDPKTLPMGLIMRVFVIICLVRSIRAALAWQREGGGQAATV